MSHGVFSSQILTRHGAIQSNRAQLPFGNAGDGWTEEKGFQSPGMNSFNHYSFGAVAEWMYRNIAGIQA